MELSIGYDQRQIYIYVYYLMHNSSRYLKFIDSYLAPPCSMQGILRDGTRAAIKILSSDSKQGTKEFLTEINMISTVRHPNLVQLIGCCVEDKNRILLYEYLENNSLSSVLLRKIRILCTYVQSEDHENN